MKDNYCDAFFLLQTKNKQCSIQCDTSKQQRFSAVHIQSYTNQIITFLRILEKNHKRVHKMHFVITALTIVTQSIYFVAHIL